MGAGMILSHDELVELTGKQRQSAQRQVLLALGIPFKIRPDGSLVVLEAAVQAALGHPSRTEHNSRPKLRLPA